MQLLLLNCYKIYRAKRLTILTTTRHLLKEEENRFIILQNAEAFIQTLARLNDLKRVTYIQAEPSE